MEKKEYFKNKFGNVFGEQVVTPVGRAIYTYLKEPNRTFKPEKYGLTILFDKKTTPKDELNKLIIACKEVANGGASFTYGPLRNGDDPTEKTGKPRADFVGNWYIQAKSSQRPFVVQSKNGANVDVDPDIIVPGVLVRAVVQVILFDSGFAYGLKVVQFIKDDGKRFMVGADPRDLLDVLGEEPSVEESEDETIEESADKALTETPVKKAKGKAAALDLL
jgi:hypothetical protein